MAGSALEKIKSILRPLQNNPTVTTVRSELKKLNSCLKEAPFRQQLANESGGENASIFMKCKALSRLWEIVFQVSMNALKVASQKSTAKPNIDEYRTFANLILNYNRSCELDGDLRPRISTKAIKSLHEFVLGGDLLENDRLVRVAEEALLESLLRICQQHDFVRVMTNQTFEYIIDEMGQRLAPEEDAMMDVTSSVLRCSANILEALISSTFQLGISMHRRLKDCFDILLTPCKMYVGDNPHPNLTEPIVLSLVRSFTTLLSSEADQAVGLMSKYAGPLLGCVKRLYPRATEAKSKEDLVKYLIAHLIACQVAGMLQGLPPGDLGDVGKASLTLDSVNGLLEMVGSPSEIARIVGVRKDGTARKSSSNWSRLDARCRSHLELVARLVAVAQRLFLVTHEWQALKDPVDHILNAHFTSDPNSHVEDNSCEIYKSLPQEMLAKSPFLGNVLCPLWCSVDDHTSQEATAGVLSQLPMLILLRGPPPAKRNIVECLQTITACAEMYPLGECWSTCTGSNWYEFKPKDLLFEDRFLAKTGSAQDIATVVYVVGRVLCFGGRPGGDSRIQLWALRALLQLSESSLCVHCLLDYDMGSLEQAWQFVWLTLFSSTLQYAGMTRNTEPGSTGELVIALISKLIHFGCSDFQSITKVGTRPFLQAEHQNVLALPAFSDALSVKSPLLFDLIALMSQRFGFSGAASERIDPGLPDHIRDEDLNKFPPDFLSSSRFKLVCFCIRCFEHFISSHQARDKTTILDESIVRCVRCLVLCDIPSRIRPFFDDDEYKVTSMSSERRKVELPCELDKPYELLCRAKEDVRHALDSCESSSSVNTLSLHLVQGLRELITTALLSPTSTNSQTDSAPSLNGDCNNVTHNENMALVSQTHALKFCLQIICSERRVSDDGNNELQLALQFWQDLSLKFVKEMQCTKDLSVLETRLIPILRTFVVSLLEAVPQELLLHELRDGFESLQNVCKEALRTFCFAKLVIEPQESVLKVQGRDEFHFAEDDDEAETTHGNANASRLKRSRQGGCDASSKRQKPNTAIKSVHVIYTVAEILILLDPSQATYAFVYDQLALKSNESSEEAAENLVYVLGAQTALNVILCTFSFLAGVRCQVASSPLGICLSIAGELKECAQTGDDYFVDAVFQAVLVLSSYPNHCLLRDEEVTKLTHLLLLTSEKDLFWLRMRPVVILKQMVAAVKAFQACGASFQQSFAKSFAAHFVLDCLNMPFIHVRIKATHALGVALRTLSKQKYIYDQVAKNLRLSCDSGNEEPILVNICEAQKNRNDSLSHSSWLIRFVVLRTWAVLAGCTKLETNYRERLFDCLRFASWYERAVVGLIVADAIHKLALLRGYQSSEALVRDEREYIWTEWLKQGQDVFHIPLNFVSQKLLNCCSRMGLRSTAIGKDHLLRENVQQLAKAATDEFVTDEISSILPVLLRAASKSDLDALATSQVANISPTLHDSLTELENVTNTKEARGKNGEENASEGHPIVGLIASNLYSILGKGVVDATEETGENPTSTLLDFAVNVMGSIIDDPAQRHILHLALRHVIQILGRFQSTSVRPVLCHAILLDPILPAAWPTVSDVFRNGAVEHLMTAKYSLEIAETDSQIIRYWESFALVVNMIFLDHQGCEFVQELATRTVLGILLDQRFRCCHVLAISLVSEHMAKDNLTSGLKIFRLISATLHVHTHSQQCIVTAIDREWEASTYKDNSDGFGLLTLDLDREAVMACRKSVPVRGEWMKTNIEHCSTLYTAQDRDLAIASYDLLQKILRIFQNNLRSLAREFVDLSCFGGDHSLEYLQIFDKKFYAQILVRDYLDSVGDLDGTNVLELAIARFSRFKEEFSADSSGSDSRLLWDELSHLSSLLSGPSFVDEGYRVDHSALYKLVKGLLEVASEKACQLELRVEASKSIGYIGPRMISRLLYLDGQVHEVPRWHASVKATSRDSRKDLSITMVAHVMEFVVSQMKSADAMSGLALLHSCTGMVSCEEGREAINRVSNSTNKAFLTSLLGPTVKKKAPFRTPSISFVQGIKDFVSATDEDSTWCWCRKLWDITETTYEVWITRLVSSLILCCYPIRSRKHSNNFVQGTFKSFRSLGQLAALSASVATFAFPRIVLDLLLSDSEERAKSVTHHLPVKESWLGHPGSLANEKISSSFTVVAQSLAKSTDSEKVSKVSAVLADSIEILNTVSRQQFMASPFKRSVAPKQTTRNNSKGPRRFGSVLNIAPKDAGHMFIGSSRVASAVLFSEMALIDSDSFHIVPKNQSQKDQLRRLKTKDSILTFLQDSMSQLNEAKAASAYALRSASLNFSTRDFRLTNCVIEEGPHGGNAHLTSSGVSKRLHLDEIRSIGVLKAYFDATFDQEVLSRQEKNELQEQWHKSTLQHMEWAENIDTVRNAGFVSNSDSSGFFGSLSTAISKLNSQDHTSFIASLENCRQEVLSTLSIAYGSETLLSAALPVSEYCGIINQLEVVPKTGTLLPKATQSAETDITDQFSMPSEIGGVSLSLQETIIRILGHRGVVHEDFGVNNQLIDHISRSANFYTINGCFTSAEECLQRLKSLIPSMEYERHMNIRLEEAKLLECRGFAKIAIHTAKVISEETESKLSGLSEGMMNDAKRFALLELKSNCLLSCGNWARKHKMESARHVQEEYFMPASVASRTLLDERKSPADSSRLSRCCLALAQTATILFEGAHTRHTSKEWKEKQDYLCSQRALFERLYRQCRKEKKGGPPNQQKQLQAIKKRIKRMEDEAAYQEKQLNDFAVLAIQCFGEALNLNDSSATNWTRHIFKMVSIWFLTSEMPGDYQQVHDNVESLLDNGPSSSHRFVPLAYQLFARVSCNNGADQDLFQHSLFKLVSIMCTEHPYHCLPMLFALSRGAGKEEADSKVRAAKTILSSLRQSAPDNLLALICGYENLTESYILAAEIVKEDLKGKKGILFSKVFSALRKKRLDKVLDNATCPPCVITRPPTLQEDHNYGDFTQSPPGTELIVGFKPAFDVTSGGRSMPKIVYCKGSKGKSYPQLVKGGDDTRSDAVMQQVFEYTNVLMRKRMFSPQRDSSGKEAAVLRKPLKLVTYNIIPLNPQTGVLEFVSDTQELKSYLVDSKNKTGAHSRYNEGEWNQSHCWKTMGMVREKRCSLEEKRKAFDRVCDNIFPVFRYFFVEKFGHDPLAWHTAKMAYSRSCAVNSIVGHILGIGDRHMSNIMIQITTGELVHIDFGMVFEQGKTLPTPETVPFRLTRDIVDGLGPNGTEGTFTAAAEETTRTLRENTDALLTILSAVVSDPLYHWKQGAEKLRAIMEKEEAEDGSEAPLDSSSHRRGDSSSVNVDASQAIARIKEKLQGYEEGTSEAQSVEGQVQLLIQAARDRDNLCQIYEGWTQWL